MEYTQQQWLEQAKQQPELTEDIPVWLRDFARAARTGNIQDLIADEARRVPERDAKGNPPRYSAVLVLLGGDSLFVPGKDAAEFPENATMLLTHRNPSMREHSGQVAFPGGRREPQDEGPIQTALREAWEETGVNPEGIQPLAVMEPIYIDRSNFAVVPVLAYWAEPIDVYPATSENDWVKAYPLSELVDPEKRFHLHFEKWSGPGFDVEGMILWGFTGSVVTALLQRAGWEKPWEQEARSFDLFRALRSSANGEALSAMAKGFKAAGSQGGAP